MAVRRIRAHTERRRGTNVWDWKKQTIGQRDLTYISSKRRVGVNRTHPNIDFRSRVLLALEDFGRCVGRRSAPRLEQLIGMVEIAETKVRYFDVEIGVEQEIFSLWRRKKVSCCHCLTYFYSLSWAAFLLPSNHDVRCPYCDKIPRPKQFARISVVPFSRSVFRTLLCNLDIFIWSGMTSSHWLLYE